MKWKIDRKADALYLELEDSLAFESEEIAPGVILDYDKDGKVVGIEVLYLSKRGDSSEGKNLGAERVERDLETCDRAASEGFAMLDFLEDEKRGERGGN